MGKVVAIILSAIGGGIIGYLLGARVENDIFMLIAILMLVASPWIVTEFWEK